MTALIDAGGRIDDRWTRIDDSQAIGSRRRVIVGVARLLRERQFLQASAAEVGVELEAENEVEQIADCLSWLKLVALRFELFADGRAFSQARLLRERYAFRGIIRARGEVLRDQLAFMQQCGFDQFELAFGEEVEAALGAFAEISRGYQPGFAGASRR